MSSSAHLAASSRSKPRGRVAPPAQSRAPVAPPPSRARTPPLQRSSRAVAPTAKRITNAHQQRRVLSLSGREGLCAASCASDIVLRGPQSPLFHFPVSAQGRFAQPAALLELLSCLESGRLNLSTAGRAPGSFPVAAIRELR